MRKDIQIVKDEIALQKDPSALCQLYALLHKLEQTPIEFRRVEK